MRAFEQSRPLTKHNTIDHLLICCAILISLHRLISAEHIISTLRLLPHRNPGFSFLTTRCAIIICIWSSKFPFFCVALVVRCRPLIQHNSFTHAQAHAQTYIKLYHMYHSTAIYWYVPIVDLSWMQFNASGRIVVEGICTADGKRHRRGTDCLQKQLSTEVYAVRIYTCSTLWWFRFSFCISMFLCVIESRFTTLIFHPVRIAHFFYFHTLSLDLFELSYARIRATVL